MKGHIQNVTGQAVVVEPFHPLKNIGQVSLDDSSECVYIYIYIYMQCVYIYIYIYAVYKYICSIYIYMQ